MNSLKTYNCYITDISLIEIGKHCPDLQTLHINNHDGITDEGIIEISKHCKKLQTLHIWEGRDTTGLITDTGVIINLK